MKYYTLYDNSGTAKYQTIATSATAAQSAAITADRILITSSVTNYIKFGTNPTAVAGTDFLLPAGVPVMFNFVSGQKVSIVGTSGYVTILDLD